MVGLMDAATFSNIEHQSLEFVTFCLRPWMTRWRQSIQRDLISESDRDIFAEHLPDDLLRGDVKGRYEAYKIAIDAGWMHRNEVRERENLNTVDGLDKFLESQNTRPAGSGVEEGQALLPADDDDAVMRAVTDKIATRFANTIGKRADKQAGDPQRFKVWAIGELEKQQARTAFDLRSAGMDEDRARAVAGKMVDHALNWLERDETAEQVIAAWRSVLGAELREITKNGVAHAEH
jgi:hypothetical protein